MTAGPARTDSRVVNSIVPIAADEHPHRLRCKCACGRTQRAEPPLRVSPASGGALEKRVRSALDALSGRRLAPRESGRHLGAQLAQNEVEMSAAAGAQYLLEYPRGGPAMP